MPWTPLHIAIADEVDLKVHNMAQDGTILQWLNETDDAGVTPLHLAAETAQTAIVQVRASCSQLRRLDVPFLFPTRQAVAAVAGLQSFPPNHIQPRHADASCG